jgi:F-type H+-transporting ATPase subunit gamma
MPSTREIRRRIRSAKNVSQITRAMEMVSASKMRKAQRNVLATRPYIDRMLDVMAELTIRMQDNARKGTLMEEREEIQHVGIILVTPDRGLCGSLVTNVLRRASRFILEQREAGRAVSLFTIGKKGRDYMMRNRQPVKAETTGLGDAPRIEEILGITTHVVKGFRGQLSADDSANGGEPDQYDEVYVIYSEFVNTLVQRAALKRLLPIEPPTESSEQRVDYTYEPDQEEVLDELLPRYVEAQLYQAVLESIASEHSARMVAMRNATNNAKELVQDLTLSYNRARQSNITKEVTEISTGAMALEG